MKWSSKGWDILFAVKRQLFTLQPHATCLRPLHHTCPSLSDPFMQSRANPHLIGDKLNDGLYRRHKGQFLKLFPDSPGSLFWVEALATMDHAPWSLQTKHSSSWLLSTAISSCSLRTSDSSACRALGDTEAPAGVEPVVLHTHVPVTSWIRHVPQQWLSTTISTSSQENGTFRNGLSLTRQVFPNTGGCDFPSPDPEGLMRAPLLPRPLVTWANPWEELTGQERATMYYTDGSATIVCDGACLSKTASRGDLSFLSPWWYRRPCTAPLPTTRLCAYFY